MRQEPQVLAAWLRSLRAQLLPEGVELELCVVDDCEDPRSSALLRESGAAVMERAEVAPPSAYVVDAETHRWDVAGFERVALAKQALLDHAAANGADYFFFVDSDLLLEPTTLRSMLSVRQPLVNAVFWTRWTPQAPAQPQVWLKHPYGFHGLGQTEAGFLEALGERQLRRVIGGGACLLVDLAALKAAAANGQPIVYHPRMGSALPSDGMWQGEDRSFAVRAERAHLRQWADSWPDIFHAYHPQQRTQAMLDAAWEALSAPRQTAAGYGDLISLTLTPLTDHALQGVLRPEARSVRGRLGALRMLPELEVAVQQMDIGTKRIVELSFPAHWPLRNYAGGKGLVLAELVDVKPFGYAPVLAEQTFAGVAVS